MSGSDTSAFTRHAVERVNNCAALIRIPRRSLIRSRERERERLQTVEDSAWASDDSAFVRALPMADLCQVLIVIAN